MNTLSERLRAEREHQDLTQGELAKRSGCGQSLIAGLESGDQLSSKYIPAIAKALRVDALWLAEGKGKKNKSDVQPMEPGGDRLPIRRVKFKLSAGVSGFEIELDQKEGEPIFMNRRWFNQNGYRPDALLAIRITGRSMEPSLYADDLVIINTADAMPKDGVVFAVNYEGEMLIKRLKQDAGSWYLASDNPDKIRFTDKLCTEACLILGKVIYRQTEMI